MMIKLEAQRMLEGAGFEVKRPFPTQNLAGFCNALLENGFTSGTVRKHLSNVHHLNTYIETQNHPLRHVLRDQSRSTLPDETAVLPTRLSGCHNFSGYVYRIRIKMPDAHTLKQGDSASAARYRLTRNGELLS